jgi:YD repeat-containing protein
VEQLRWSRIHVTGEKSPEGHSHSFYRDGDDKRIVRVEVGIMPVGIFTEKCDNLVEYRSTRHLGKISWLAR